MKLPAIPHSVIEKAKTIFHSKERVWGSVYITWDADFGHYFINPFHETGDDNLYSVARIERGELVYLP